jgi:phenylpyruvate tautomerase PptA (4-oxalocrotonate tautomerase family)
MPYFSIETNQNIEETARQDLLKKTSAFISELLGKPEQYVMTVLKPDTAMEFAGSDQPTAFVRLKSIGLPHDRCGDLSRQICDFLEQHLGVAKDRVFIDFKDLERHLFGWSGKTF